ncbi:MAG: MBL fold metallo-hydrolase [Firmicutes bacterium]|nr:MBL fold metallo-hydrolase [Bacillota bacterium]
MVKKRVKQVQHEDVTALHCSYYFLGNGFRAWTFHVDGLMVETGPRRARSEVRRFAQRFHPQAIAVTHFHEDHTGNAADLATRYRIPVYMSAQTARILSGSPRIPLYRRVVWGPLDPVRGEVQDRIETDRYCFQAVPTPGHARDHVAWVEEEQGWAFTGDLFIANRHTYGLRDESISQLAASIRRVLRYPIQTVFCSHAGVIPDGVTALRKKLDFLEWLQAETLRLYKEGACSREIAARLLKRRPALVCFSNGELSPVHLIRSILREHR